MTAADRRVLPGFKPAISLTVGYVSILILIPLATLVLKSASLGPAAFWAAMPVLGGLVGGKKVRRLFARA